MAGPRSDRASVWHFKRDRGACESQRGLWVLHAVFVWTLSIPPATPLAEALFDSRLPSFNWWTGLVYLAYLTRVALATASMLSSFSRMRRSKLLEISGMKLNEVEHVRGCFTGELAQGVRLRS